MTAQHPPLGTCGTFVSPTLGVKLVSLVLHSTLVHILPDSLGSYCWHRDIADGGKRLAIAEAGAYVYKSG